MSFLKIVMCCLCIKLGNCSMDTYKAAILEDSSIVSNENKLMSMIHRAAKLDVDILMLPKISDEECLRGDKIEKLRKSVATAAVNSKIYVALQTVEGSHCGGREKAMTTNMVFDRNGANIVSFRARRSSLSYNSTSAVDTFTTDFGVTFALVSEEDLLLNPHDLDGINNVIAFGPLVPDSILFAQQFPASWSLITKSNLITSRSVYGGRSTAYRGLILAELNSGEPKVFNTEPAASLAELDMSLYSWKPLNLVPGVSGYVESVCHGRFCCEFQINTTIIGSKVLPYALVAFDGTHKVGRNNIGVRTCGLVACGGHHAKACYHELQNSTTIIFEKLTISGVFTKHSELYPVMVSASRSTYAEDVKLDIRRSDEANNVRIELLAKHVISFGIFGRDFSKDFKTISTSKMSLDLSDFSVDFEELFDYVWIRLRVVIFIVSIYVLEML